MIEISPEARVSVEPHGGEVHGWCETQRGIGLPGNPFPQISPEAQTPGEIHALPGFRGTRPI